MGSGLKSVKYPLKPQSAKRTEDYTTTVPACSFLYNVSGSFYFFVSLQGPLLMFPLSPQPIQAPLNSFPFPFNFI